MTGPARELTTERLVLEPLRVEHASEMVAVLGDRSLYEFTGGQPPNAEELITRYGFQVVGPDRSEDPDEQWLNWIVRRFDRGQAVGYVQATVVGSCADIAWLIGVDHQRQGFAVEAAAAMARWLASEGIDQFDAYIHPGHEASGRVATAVGLHQTATIDEDGEHLWTTASL